MNIDNLTTEDIESLKTSINGVCDWCGAYVHCDKCEDLVVYRRMNSGEIDDPTDEAQGGHIHWCSPEHLVFWTDAHYWGEHEDCVPDGLELPQETIDYWVSKGITQERFEGKPGCECHERRRALFRDTEAAWKWDADTSEDEKKLAAEILSEKVQWCSMCDEWVPTEKMRRNTWDQGPPMCIACKADNNISDSEMREENQ